MSDVLQEVPASLKRLVRIIMQTLYPFEQAITVQYIVHYPCIKEDDLAELLQFDKKQLRIILNSLKIEKFLKQRLRMETDAAGKVVRHLYYYLNYNVFVNIVKYKLDHVRRKIEMSERESTSRAAYKCPRCSKVFSDLDVNELIDFNTGLLVCSFCKTEVEEQAVANPTTEARKLMQRFNQQFSIIFSLLQEVEDIRLAPSLLEPEPLDFATKQRLPAEPTRKGWSGEATQRITYGSTELVVNVRTTQEEFEEKKATKEVPVWMSQSTVDGADVVDLAQPSAAQSASSRRLKKEVVDKPFETDDIMRTLLLHERAAGGGGGPSGVQAAANSGRQQQNNSDDEASSASDDEDMTSAALTTSGGDVEKMESGDEETDDTPMVQVNGQAMSYYDVDDDVIKLMSPGELQAYINLGRELYSRMHD